MIDEIQSAIQYVFREQTLLDEALTHKSYFQGSKDSGKRDNERLEFLGDAVLSLVICEYLAEAFPTSQEGELSKIKARLVSGPSLAVASKRLKLGQWLKIGRGEERTKGREKNSLLSNALEALIASVYLDGGLEAARSFVLRILRPELDELSLPKADRVDWDYKSRLQEWSHKYHETVPEYRIKKESGPDHQKAFEIEVLIKGQVLGHGKGKTKKDAEQQAACQALKAR